MYVNLTINSIIKNLIYRPTFLYLQYIRLKLICSKRSSAVNHTNVMYERVTASRAMN